MKNFICIVAGVAMTIANFTSSVQAGFQTYQYETGCAFNLEHETTNNSGTGVSNTVEPGTTNTQTNSTVPRDTNQPVITTTPSTTANPIIQCPDPGYGGGSIALAVFLGLFFGIILTLVGITVAVTQIAGEPLSDLINDATKNPLAPNYNSDFGEYGTFALEPTYYPESDAPGLRFSFRF